MGYAGRSKNMVWLYRGFDKFTMAYIATHELGHTLGLNHEDRRCAVMNSNVGAKCSAAANAWQYRCRLIEQDDINGVLRLYGGRNKGPSKKMFCDRAKGPGPVANLSVAQVQPASMIDISNVSFLTPKNPVDNKLINIVVVVKKDACATSVNGEAGITAIPTPGKTQMVLVKTDEYTPVVSGNYCISVAVQDQYGRVSGLVSAWVTYTQPPPPPVAPVTGLTATQLPDYAPYFYAELSWLTPAETDTDGIIIRRKINECPTDSADPAFASVTDSYPLHGQTQTASDYDNIAPGNYCYGVWVMRGTVASPGSFVWLAVS